jgi:hypothetical protein
MFMLYRVQNLLTKLSKRHFFSNLLAIVFVKFFFILRYLYNTFFLYQDNSCVTMHTQNKTVYEIIIFVLPKSTYNFQNSTRNEYEVKMDERKEKCFNTKNT